MYRLYAVWSHPEDIEGFEQYYESIHAPKAAAIPGLQRLVLTRTSDVLGEGEAPFHRIAELWFEDRAALDAAIDSPELTLAAEDAAEMEERFGVTLYSPAGSTVDSALGPYTGPA